MIDIKSQASCWRIAEQQGRSWRDGESATAGRMSFQSALTGSIAEEVLGGGQPPLPEITDVVRFERLLLAQLISHRAAAGGPVDRLDVT